MLWMARGEWGGVDWVAMSNWSHPAGATHEWVTLAECQHCGSGDVAVADGSRRVGRCRLGGDVELVAPGRSDPRWVTLAECQHCDSGGPAMPIACVNSNATPETH